MNKILKGLLFFTLMAFTMVSCKDEADTPDPGSPSNPEKEIVGTYNGSWSKTTRSTGAVVEFTGTITFTASEYPYVVEVNVKADDGSFDKTASANVVKQSGGYKFYNELGSNPIGAPFTGVVDNNGEASIYYVVTERSGKRTVVNEYRFAGDKK